MNVKLKSIVLVIAMLSYSLLYGQGFSSKDSSIIDNIISDSVKDGYGCSVLIEADGNVVYYKQYGFCIKSANKKTDTKTLFNIASITKTITALGVLKLVQDGKLDVNSKIGRFFSNVHEDKKNITISMLLSHTSGLQQNYVCQGVGSMDTAVIKIMNDTLAFAPGTDFSYSNENYELLAAVIESVSGIDYEQFISREVLMPAGMTNTYFWNEGYDMRESIAEMTDLTLSPKRDWDFLGSGGIFSNAEDLYKLYKTVKENKILNKEYSDLMFKEHFKLKSGLVIGYGWYINNYGSPGMEKWTRGTESFGHNAVIRWFPDKKITVIVLTNSGELYGPSGTANRTISDAIINVLINK